MKKKTDISLIYLSLLLFLMSILINIFPYLRPRSVSSKWHVQRRPEVIHRDEV